MINLIKHKKTMKSKGIALIALLSVNLLCYSQEKIVELPLTVQNGYGHFSMGLGGANLLSAAFASNVNNPWFEDYLKLSISTPEGLTDIQYGFIETPIKSNIYFAFGKDSEGIIKIVIDANNNLDLSDDILFVPLDMSVTFFHNIDSLTQSHAVNISFETFVNNEMTLVNFPFFIVYNSQINMWLCNFPQYATTQFKGKQIAICNFTDLSYNNINLAFVPNDLKDGEKVKKEDLYNKNEYIEIEDEIYKILEVNVNKNTLILEKIDLPKTQLYSTQTGYRPYPFHGEEFTTKTPISLESLKGKYVLLDFWAEWCGPCIAEFPHLKELYSKTDRVKFEIIGIAGRSSVDGIRKLIDQHEVTWLQIFSDDTNKIIEKYEIRSYPRVFLIDTEGIVIAKDLRGEELEEKILSLIED
jgi:thiol-disulfide isomerase/thioredoxin